MYGRKRKYRPTKAEAQEFAQKMREIKSFCIDNDISASSNYDSYYFTINGQEYRVSNHSVELSNERAYNPYTGEQMRRLYHPGGRDPDVIYIHAGKTRIIDIYNDLRAGYELDGRGNRKNSA